MIARVALTPSISGIEMSIRITSGFSDFAIATACLPSLASPTTAMWVYSLSIPRAPARKIGRSSTIRTRIRSAIPQPRPSATEGPWKAIRAPPIEPLLISTLPPSSSARSRIPRSPNEPALSSSASRSIPTPSSSMTTP
ncbi:MAG: hypothetical protein QOE92_2595 [Chloroflexota bacterium]|nr:hypothetical protein [Chloroflexota bacterium]